jgi:hypothetical protein
MNVLGGLCSQRTGEAAMATVDPCDDGVFQFKLPEGDPDAIPFDAKADLSFPSPGEAHRKWTARRNADTGERLETGTGTAAIDFEKLQRLVAQYFEQVTHPESAGEPVNGDVTLPPVGVSKWSTTEPAILRRSPSELIVTPGIDSGFPKDYHLAKMRFFEPSSPPSADEFGELLSKELRRVTGNQTLTLARPDVEAFMAQGYSVRDVEDYVKQLLESQRSPLAADAGGD